MPFPPPKQAVEKRFGVLRQAHECKLFNYFKLGTVSHFDRLRAGPDAVYYGFAQKEAAVARVGQDPKNFPPSSQDPIPSPRFIHHFR
jgi:hypothetical protein